MTTSLPEEQTRGAEPAFAHPVEREIARVFDDHGLAWLYEPHTFVIERSPDGTVRQAFTPDFYLPELDLYVECTVLRHGLMSRKRKKARAVRRQGVTVEVLGLRDIERLARRWELDRLAHAAGTRPVHTRTNGCVPERTRA